MEIIYGVLVAWLMSVVALGVGSSTLAIVGFMVALRDGTIDEGERRILGTIYWLLRSSMLMIAGLIAVLAFIFPGSIESTYYAAFMVLMLFINAVLMTKHLVPATIGPAFQAATWYTLGFLFSIEAFDLMDLSVRSIGLLYIIDIVVMLAIVNLALKLMKNRRI